MTNRFVPVAIRPVDCSLRIRRLTASIRLLSGRSAGLFSGRSAARSIRRSDLRNTSEPASVRASNFLDRGKLGKQRPLSHAGCPSVASGSSLRRWPRTLNWLIPALCLVIVPAFAGEPPRVIVDSTEMSIPSITRDAAGVENALRIPFAIFDPDSETLAVAAASGNQSIVANGDIRVEGEGEQRTLVIEEIQRSGNLLLTIAVFDGEQWSMEKIDLTVGEGEGQQ
jgi:hypothetical protein